MREVVRPGREMYPLATADLKVEREGDPNERWAYATNEASRRLRMWGEEGTVERAVTGEGRGGGGVSVGGGMSNAQRSPE
jgi:hypothetical protein